MLRAKRGGGGLRRPAAASGEDVVRWARVRALQSVGEVARVMSTTHQDLVVFLRAILVTSSDGGAYVHFPTVNQETSEEDGGPLRRVPRETVLTLCRDVFEDDDLDRAALRGPMMKVIIGHALH